MSSDRLFKNACEILDVVKCSETPDARYTDPCNCYDTYYCLHLEVRRERCAEGTAFDGERCNHENEVLLKACDADRPWLRCNVSDSRLDELAHICGGSTSTQLKSTTEKLTQTLASVQPRGDNLGLIIGVAIAAFLVAILVFILVVLFVRKRKAKDKIARDRQGTVQNPEYFEDGNIQDPYAVIDDSLHSLRHVNTYIDTSEQNGSLQYDTMADTLPPNTDTVYDNSALREEPSPGYEQVENTLKPDDSEPKYFTLSNEGHADTESNNNTPKHFEYIPQSVVRDDAIQVETGGIQTGESFQEAGSSIHSGNIQDMDDDSPYKG